MAIRQLGNILGDIYNSIITIYSFYLRFAALRRENFHGFFDGKFARLTAIFMVRESNFPKTHENSLGFANANKKNI